MKRFLKILSVLILFIGVLAGCSDGREFENSLGSIYDLSQVKSIFCTAMVGNKIYITIDDPDVVAEVCEHVGKIELVNGTPSETEGYDYGFNLRDAEGKSIVGFNISGPSQIGCNGYYYKLEESWIYDFLVEIYS